MCYGAFSLKMLEQTVRFTRPFWLLENTDDTKLYDALNRIQQYIAVLQVTVRNNQNVRIVT